jgi:hypothetical protein
VPASTVLTSHGAASTALTDGTVLVSTTGAGITALLISTAS